MSLNSAYRKNFDTMLRAAADGRLAMVECLDKATGRPVAVVCAMSDDPDCDGNLIMLPFAKMFDDDPYEELLPPCPDGGFYAEDGSIVHAKNWFIVGTEDGEDVYWNNDLGWVGDARDATYFNDEEKAAFALPMSRNKPRWGYAS